MIKRGEHFWDILPLIVIVVIVGGSLLFVDFTGMAVTCVDGDGDGVSSCTGCGVPDSVDVGELNAPQVSDGNVIYEFNDGGTWRVGLLDLSSGLTSTLSNDVYSALYPDLDGSSAAWIEKETFVGESSLVYTQNLVNVVSRPSSRLSKFNPTIYGSNIVYPYLTTEGVDLAKYPIGGSADFFVADGLQAQPDLFGGRLVYHDDSGGDYDIYYMSDVVSFSNPQPIVTGSGDQKFPKIYADRVVWQSDEEGDWDVYMYDLSSSQEIAISAIRGVDEKYAYIYDNKIVWSDNRQGGWNIYLYDLDLSEEFAITMGTDNNNVAPTIDDEYIVWQAGEGAGATIEYYEIDALSACLVVDCDDSDDSVYGGAEELCDGIDNNCDGVVDEGCVDTGVSCELDEDCGVNETCIDGVCVLDEGEEVISESCLVEGYWSDDETEISQASMLDIIYGNLIGDGCEGTDVTFDLYLSDVNGDYSEDDLVATYEGYYYESYDAYDFVFDNSLTDGYYVFVASDGLGVLESTPLLYCSDLNDCGVDSEVLEVVGELPVCYECLIQGYSYFVSDVEYITSILSGEYAYLFATLDGTCSDVTFYLYKIIEEDGVYVTGDLVTSFTGEMYEEEYEGEYYYGALAEWLTEEEGYYYFITVAGGCADYSDSIYVCSGEPCDYGLITISDAASVAASYFTVDVDGEEVVEEEEEEEEIDCASEWDCSGVEWEECDPSTGTRYRNLELCVLPESDICYDEKYWPEYEVDCEIDVETIDDRAPADVPFFGWFNLLIVVFVLISYYYCQEFKR